MRNYLLILSLLISLSGCAVHSLERDGLRAADGLSEYYPADADKLAQVVADELSRRYAPAQTELSLLLVPGQFGESLEQGLRAHGFAVQNSPDAQSGVRVAAVTDVIQEQLQTPSGYVEVYTSDGQRFSMMRRLSGGMLPVPQTPVETAPVVAAVPVVSVVPLQPEQPVASSAPSTPSPSLSYGVPTPASASVPTYPVRKAASAEAIARRNQVPVEAFCRWNQVAKADVLPKRREVYLSEPPVVATAQESVVTPERKPVAEQAVAAMLSDMAGTPAPSSASSPEPVQTVSTPALAPATAPVSAPLAEALVTPAVSAESSPSVLPIIPLVVVQEWKLQPGSLHDQLGAWAAREGWQIVWKAPDDLDMESSATFSGDFLGAVRQLFEGLYRSGHPLCVTLYQGNKVAEITLQ